MTSAARSSSTVERAAARAALALVAALLASLLSAACGGSASDPPRSETQPDVAMVPTAPAPQPTPTPTPGTEPDPEPYPSEPGGGGGNVSGDCGEPLPPPIARVNVKLQGASTSRALLDSTPLVSDAAYCRQIGFSDGRSVCPVRMEGDPERQACEALRVGRAADTGRPGPTWSANGKRCDGPDGGTACLNHSDNQYLVWAYGSGRFRACTAGGVCGELVIP